MGSLFEDLRFFFAQRVPNRQHFIEAVKQNGGQVVPLEKFADIKIADHLRKDIVPGTTSYRYIDLSIKNGALEDLDDHAIGPPEGTPRAIGSVIQPSKSGRTPFTAEDDRILMEWIAPIVATRGMASGNEIYKQLGTKYQQHPWQSWRDRWVKVLSKRPRPVPVVETSNTGSAKKAKLAATATIKTEVSVPTERDYTQEDYDILLKHAPDILEIEPTKVGEAWQAWAEANPAHSARDWRNLWQDQVRPGYEAQLANDNDSSNREQSLRSPSLGLASPALVSKSLTPQKTKFRQPPSSSPTQPNGAEPSESDGAGPYFSRKRKRAPRTEEQESLTSPSHLESPKNKRGYTTGRTEKSRDSIPDRTGYSPAKSIYPDLNGHQETFLSEEPMANGLQTGSDRSPPSLSEPAILRQLQRAAAGLDEVTESEDADADCEEEVEYPNLETGVSEKAMGKRRAEDTQAIFDAETQQADLMIPAPLEGWDDIEDDSQETFRTASQGSNHSPRKNGSRKRAEPNPTDVNAQIDEWIDDQLSKGVQQDYVQMALLATNIDLDLAEIALHSLVRSGRLPNIKGVWSAMDDRKLNAVDAREIAYLETKHGRDGFHRRYKFLKELNSDTV
ncbi:hypothetical protein MMC25_003470 [Agyrium rufum]|nr:hypothetical protein [Agyrium rufum]